MIIAGLGVSVLSLIGVLFFGERGHMLGTHRFILPTAVGVFLGMVFFELIPETLEASAAWGPVAIAIGFLGFYLLSHFLETFHHHHVDAHDHCHSNGAQKLLIGDAIHNMADGIVIATAFMINPMVGVLTTIGIALHEIPQEIAEFGVLMQSGYTRSKALALNFISSLSVIVGIVVTYFFAHTVTEYVFILTGIAAGNLLYIATTDLIPELRHSHRDHFYTTFLATVTGLILIAGLITYTHETFGGHAHEDEHTEEDTHGHATHEEESHLHTEI